jgi:23S rRNA A2030 N6-methylase RlmJ
MTDQADRTVGNLGDILKHGALVRLARLAAQRAIRAPVTYIDTHAYLLEAECEDPLSWKRNINREMSRHPAYTDYVRRQKERLDAGEPYRCSAGLALDIISERNYHAILAEEDDDRRRTLKSQVRQAGYRAEYTLSNLDELAEIEPPKGEDEDEDDHAGGSLLMLVDPVTLDDDVWSKVCNGLDNFIEEESEAMVLVVQQDPDSEQPEWPEAPTHFDGPVARLHRKPFHLALYSTESMITRALPEVEKLGWEILWEEEDDEDDE